jgi:hypothetical protein
MKRILGKLIESRIILMLIGIHQIFGGIFGLYLVFTQKSFINILEHLFLFLIIIGLFLFSIICGIALFYKNPVKGIKISLINQFLQLIQFKVFGFGFYYAAGIYLSIGILDVSILKFKINSSLFQSSIFLTLKSGNDTIYIFINLISVLLILFLSNYPKYISIKKT